tara:strand:+ start:146 stop:496 length:351 start_codon:yes stop_codon:yes gene_type:complete
MSYIKLPLKGTENPLQDYIVCNVDGVYELERASDSVIHLYYTSAASTADDYLRVSITYDKQSVDGVTADDVANLKALILKVNQQEGNVPMFELLSGDKVQVNTSGQGVIAKANDPI